MLQRVAVCCSVFQCDVIKRHKPVPRVAILHQTRYLGCDTNTLQHTVSRVSEDTVSRVPHDMVSRVSQNIVSKVSQDTVCRVSKDAVCRVSEDTVSTV